MNLRGVGIDIVDVARFHAVVERHGERFVRRWFDPSELMQPGDPGQNLARSFAVKEAVWKALRLSSIRHLVWRDIVATRVDDRLSVRLLGQVAAEAANVGVGTIHIAATATDRVAIATAVIVVEG